MAIELKTKLHGDFSYEEYELYYDLYKRATSVDDRFDDTRVIILIGENEILSSIELTISLIDQLSVMRSNAHFVRSSLISAGFSTMDPDDESSSRLLRESVLGFRESELMDPLHVNVGMIKALKEQYSYKSMKDFSQVTKEMISHLEKELLQCYKLTDFLDDIKKSETIAGKKSNAKPIIKFPWLYPTNNQIGIDYLPTNIEIELSDDKVANSTVKVWQEVLVSAQLKSYESKILRPHGTVPEEDILMFDDAREYSTDEGQKLRNKLLYDTQRIKIEIEVQDKINLATVGIYGKRHKNSSEKKESTVDSKKVYDFFNTSTSDIYDYVRGTGAWNFLRKNEMKYKIELPEIGLLTNELPYISKTENFDHYMDLVQITKTYDFVASTIISHIAFELNACLRKPTKENFFYVTKLQHFPIMLLTSCNKEYVFYSLLFRKTDFVMGGLPYSECFSAGQYCFTKFYSTNKSDITSPLLCNLKFAAKCQISHEIYFNASPVDVESLCEARALHLIDIENKECTTAPTSNIRYVYMKLLSPGVFSNPECVLSKYSALMRSRLYLYIVKNTISLIQDFKDKRIIEFDLERTDNKLNIELSQNYLIPGIYSVTSHNSVQRMETLVNLMYSSWYHDKNKSEHSTSGRIIVEKILKEEIKMRSATDCLRPSKTLTDKMRDASFKSHEFDPSYVIFLSRLIKDIVSKSNSNYLNDLYTRLSKKLMTDFATLKSSANYKSFYSEPHGAEHDMLKLGSHKYNPRVKCIYAVIQMITDFNFDEPFAFTNITKLFNIVRSCSGVIVNLFRKPQRTGVREIYVMTIMCRILINFVEEINRFFCEFLDNEYMTRGDRKIDDIAKFQKNCLDEYSALITKAKKNNLDDKNDKVNLTMVCITDSMDMSSWCQQFVMPVFSLLMSDLLDDSLLACYNEVMNMMTSKHLELPETLLAEFLSKSQPEFDSIKSESLNELKHQFNGVSQYHDLISEMGVLLKNRSNFMQGVLQGGGSLLHAAHGISTSKMIDDFNMKLGFMVKSTTRMITSSDDASAMTFMIIDTNKLKHNQSDMATVRLYRSTIMFANARRMCVKISVEKSTLNLPLPFVVEFNSIWVISNTVVIPLIKLSRSLFDFKVTSSSVKSQQIDSNILADMSMSGCTIRTVAVHQLLMKTASYCMLGCTLHDKNFSSTIHNKISSVHHPAAWFYLLSHGKTGCLLGWDFLMYYNMLISPRMRFVENYLRRIKLSESGELNDMNVHAFIAFGGSRKYNKFLESMDLSSDESREEIITYVESDFINGSIPLTHRRAKDRKETIFKIKIKALSPGVHDSFSPDDASKFAASSVYICKKPCITLKIRNTLESEYIRQVLASKYSSRVDEILSIRATMMSFLNIIPNGVDSGSFDKSLYCNSEFYDSILLNLNETIVMTRDKIRQPNKQKYTKIIMMRDVNSDQISLMDCVKLVWFGVKNKFYKRSVVKEAFDNYKRKIGWLSDDRLESLNFFKSLGGNVISLLSEIETYSSKVRTLKLLSPTYFKKNPIKHILSHFKSVYSNTQYLKSSSLKIHSNDSNIRISNILAHSQTTPLSSDVSLASEVMLRSMIDSIKGIRDDMISNEIKTIIGLYDTYKKQNIFLNKNETELLLYEVIGTKKFVDIWLIEQSLQLSSDGTKRYHGDGRLCRYTTEGQVIVDVTDDSIVSINFSSYSALMNNVKDLTTMMVNKLKFKIIKQVSDFCIKDVNHPVVSRSTYGIKVQKIEAMDQLILPSDLNEFKIYISDGRLKLDMNQRSRYMNILTYSPKVYDTSPSDIIPRATAIVIKSRVPDKRKKDLVAISDAWHSGSVMDTRSLKIATERLIDSCEEFDTWILDVMKRTIKKKNIFPYISSNKDVRFLTEDEQVEFSTMTQEEEALYFSLFEQDMGPVMESAAGNINKSKADFGFTYEPINEGLIEEQMCGCDFFQIDQVDKAAQSSDIFSSIVSDVSKKKIKIIQDRDYYFNYDFLSDYLKSIESYLPGVPFDTWTQIPKMFLPDDVRKNKIDSLLIRAMLSLGFKRQPDSQQYEFVDVDEDDDAEEEDPSWHESDTIPSDKIFKSSLESVIDDIHSKDDVVHSIMLRMQDDMSFSDEIRLSAKKVDGRGFEKEHADYRARLTKSLYLQSLESELANANRDINDIIDLRPDIPTNEKDLTVDFIFNRLYLSHKRSKRATMSSVIDMDEEDKDISEITGILEALKVKLMSLFCVRDPV